MADFRPLRAWKYNPEKIHFQDVIAPPYDVISPAGQKKFYERSPFNCIRLILNREEPSDTDQNNRYSRARDFFQEWQHRQILIREPQPSFYLYRQAFVHPLNAARMERTALLGRLKLEPFDQGIVIPHEKTLSKPRADRMRLLEATRTNFSPVFGLYENTSNLNSIFQAVKKREPFFSAADDENVKHELWEIREPRLTDEIQSALRPQKIYIADGHHRYQTALEYGQKIRREQNIPEDEELPSDFVYMALVGFHDPGLVVLPTHRILLKGFGADSKQALAKLETFFRVQPMELEELKKSLRNVGAGLKPAPTRMGLVLHKNSFLLTLENLNRVKAEMPPAKPDFWYRLDVNLLHYLIFNKIWNLEDIEHALRFSCYEDEAIEMIRKGEAEAAFLLASPQVDVLREMGNCGELMPQKSTYFYPKLASGLLFYEHVE